MLRKSPADGSGVSMKIRWEEFNYTLPKSGAHVDFIREIVYLDEDEL